VRRTCSVIIKGKDHTPEIEEEIRVPAQKLEKFYSAITSCRALVEVGQKGACNGKIGTVL